MYVTASSVNRDSVNAEQLRVKSQWSEILNYRQPQTDLAYLRLKVGVHFEFQLIL